MSSQPFALPFRVFEALHLGLRYVRVNFKFLVMLSVVPFVIGVVSYLLARGVHPISFWEPIYKFPLYFIIGVQTAAILRFMVLGETPLKLDEKRKAERNTFMIQAGGVFAAVKFLFMGTMVALALVSQLVTSNPEEMAPYAPFILGFMIFMLWAVRWLWLNVPVALGWDVRGFYTKLGGWVGSLCVFVLFFIALLIVNAFKYLAWDIFSAGMPDGKLSGGYRLFYDVLMAACDVAVGVVFAVFTGMAVRQMLSDKVKVDA